MIYLIPYILNKMDTIGSRIRYARNQCGLTQGDLAKKVGVTTQAISQIELGVTLNPQPQHVFSIADITGFEARWLVTGQGLKTCQEATLNSIDISDLSIESKAAIQAVVHSLEKQAKKSKQA